MRTQQTERVVPTSTGDMTIYVISPVLEEYPNAKWPGVIVWGEIYQVTAPVARFATSIASQGYIVACPCIFHEEHGAKALAYDGPGTDAGNKCKAEKALSAYDSDAKAAVDALVQHPNCTGRVGVTGLCLGGHVAFRTALDPRVLAACCFFATDIHSETLGSPRPSDSLTRAGKGEIKGELAMVFGNHDPHVPLDGRTRIREVLSSPEAGMGPRLSFLEVRANHAFLRDESSKGRYDAALSKVCFEYMLEIFTRTLARDLGEPVALESKEAKMVC